MAFFPISLLDRPRLLPVVRVIRHFLPLHAARLRGVALLGVAASAFNSAGYVLLYPLLEYATKQQAAIRIGPLQFEPTPGFFVVMVALVVAVLVGALQLNYRVQIAALDVLRKTATAAAIEGVLMLRRWPSLFDRGPPTMLARAVQEVTGQVAFACGSVMKQLSLGIADGLQLVVFVAVLMWLNLSLTLVSMSIALIAGVFYVRSLRKVAESARSTQDLSRDSRNEIIGLVRAMVAADVAEEGLRRRLEELHEKGAAGALLECKLGTQKELRRGPMLIEYVYPVALIVLPVVALVTDTFASMASTLIVYVLILRQTIGLLQGMASLLATGQRFHPQLTCYAGLIEGTAVPQCLFAAVDTAVFAADDQP